MADQLGHSKLEQLEQQHNDEQLEQQHNDEQLERDGQGLEQREQLVHTFASLGLEGVPCQQWR